MAYFNAEANPFRQAIVGMEDAGASDLIAASDHKPYYKVNGQVVPASDRVIPHLEIFKYLSDLYGDRMVFDAVSGKDCLNFGSTIKSRGLRLRFNVTAFGGTGREALKAVVRRLPLLPPLPSDINLPQAIVEAVQVSPFGIGFVGGATGSGKSTTLAALIRMMAESQARMIYTLEEPIEFIYDHVNYKVPVYQQSVGPDQDIESFARGVIEAVRQAPDLLLVGETRDMGTADSIIQFAETGHFALSSIHISRVTSLLDRFGSFFQQGMRDSVTRNLIPQLTFILVQALLRKKGGGRVAVHEYVVLDAPARNRMIQMPLADVRTFLSERMKDGQTTFPHSVRRLLSAGLIEQDEANRFLYIIGEDL